MKDTSKRSPAEALSEDVQLQEIDERHFLSQQIFFRRQERDWSQERLAEESGLTQAQVATLEAGQGNPTLRTLVKLAVAFGTTVHDLTAPQTDEADGCTVEDREGAETLREAATRYSRSREEGHSAEFRVASASDPTLSAPGRHTAFRAQVSRRVAPDLQPLVRLNLRQAATVGVEELAGTLEL